MRVFVVSIFVTLFIVKGVEAHPWKPSHYVIVDTDCGLDDYRAIQLLLASTNVRVLGIIASNGVVNAEEGYGKVKALLYDSFHEGIPVGMNNEGRRREESCDVASRFLWGVKSIETGQKHSYVKLVNEILDNVEGNISFVSLGSLNTVANCIEKCPLFSKKVKNVLWANNFNKLESSFNYLLDKNAYENIVKSKTELSFVHFDKSQEYSDTFISAIENIQVVYGNQFKRSLDFSDSPYATVIFDEAVPVFLENKDNFICDTISGFVKNYIYSKNNEQGIESMISNILKGNVEYKNQVLSRFPLDTSSYILDVQEMLAGCIEKYGKEEWMACILTSELHRHLGVYSLVGAKMGIRAKEYFGAGVDEMKIVSYAGLMPPFSCMNDGLQVSTGATLGHGLISVVDSLKLPKADFVYMGKKITISLKEEYRKQIASEIKELRFIHGLDSDIYWDLVRDLALKYWRNWDRHDVFVVEEN